MKMATRSLTEVFILMRNNALQNRNIFADQRADDRQTLMDKESEIELGLSSKNNRLPPEWMDSVEEVQFEISRIKEKIKELSGFHNKHLNRPTLDDSIDEEHAIEILTREITQMFTHCQSLIHQISTKSQRGVAVEQKLSLNVTSSLARTVQDLSLNFRRSQSNYLHKLRSREERSKQYFTIDLSTHDSSYTAEEDALTDEIFDRGFTDKQMQIVENNTQWAKDREQDVNQIVQSISDLNEIFKDLATIIVDQGTVLDRIDYNIENTSVKVEEGLQQLQKAEKHQKKNRKMLIIVILFVVLIVLIITLIAVKHR